MSPRCFWLSGVNRPTKPIQVQLEVPNTPLPADLLLIVINKSNCFTKENEKIEITLLLSLEFFKKNEMFYLLRLYQFHQLSTSALVLQATHQWRGLFGLALVRVISSVGLICGSD